MIAFNKVLYNLTRTCQDVPSEPLKVESDIPRRRRTGINRWIRMIFLSFAVGNSTTRTSRRVRRSKQRSVAHPALESGKRERAAHASGRQALRPWSRLHARQASGKILRRSDRTLFPRSENPTPLRVRLRERITNGQFPGSSNRARPTNAPGAVRRRLCAARKIPPCGHRQQRHTSRGRL